MKTDQNNRLSNDLTIIPGKNGKPEMYLGDKYISGSINSYMLDNGILTISLPVFFVEGLDKD